MIIIMINKKGKDKLILRITRGETKYTTDYKDILAETVIVKV